MNKHIIILAYLVVLIVLLLVGQKVIATILGMLGVGVAAKRGGRDVVERIKKSGGVSAVRDDVVRRLRDRLSK